MSARELSSQFGTDPIIESDGYRPGAREPTAQADSRRLRRDADRARARIASRTHRERGVRRRRPSPPGCSLIDTAHTYTGGESEETIGDGALAGPGRMSSWRRKAGTEPARAGPEALRAQIEESLRRLRTETISLYYLHRVDPETPLEESLAVIKEYRDSGKIRHIGLSEVDIDQIEQARALVPVTAVQNRYNLSERRARRRRRLLRRPGHRLRPVLPSARRRRARARRDRRATRATPAQITLAWLLRRSQAMLPIPGTLSLEHAQENLAALEIELTDEEFESLR